MNTLFPPPPTVHVFPEGFDYVPEFLSVEEENFLLQEIGKIPLHTFIFQGYEAKRKVASFGYDYNFEKRSLSQGQAIPEVFYSLMTKVSLHLDNDKSNFGELLVTEYPVGSVINWHRDAHPFDLVAGVSLLSDCTFRLRPHDKSKQGRGSIISFPVSRRSLYIMKGESRANWQHSISPVKHTRFSITLRTLKDIIN